MKAHRSIHRMWAMAGAGVSCKKRSFYNQGMHRQKIQFLVKNVCLKMVRVCRCECNIILLIHTVLSASTQSITLPVYLAVPRDSILKQKTLRQVQGAGAAFLLLLGSPSPGRDLHPLLHWDTHHLHKQGENTVVASLLLLCFCLWFFSFLFFLFQGFA